jgi:hypothetical protein
LEQNAGFLSRRILPEFRFAKIFRPFAAVFCRKRRTKRGKMAKDPAALGRKNRRSGGNGVDFLHLQV